MRELDYTAQSVPKGKRFCTICGEVKRLHYFEGDSTHCSACCEKMLHTRLNARYIPFVLVLLAVLAVSVFLSVQTVSYCRRFLPAREAIRDKRLTDACELYAETISDASKRNAFLLTGEKPDDSGSIPSTSWTFFEPGAYTWVRYLKTYMTVYSGFAASNEAQGSLDTETAARIPWIADLYEARQAYDDTLLFAEGNLAFPEGTEEDEQYKTIIEELTAHADESDSRFVKGYTAYYKGRAAQYYKKDDPSAATAFYNEMLEYIPEECMIVYTSEASAAIDAGQYDLAIEAYKKVLEINRNETDAWLSIANAAFLGGNDEQRADALAQFDEDDPQRLRMEMRFALRSDDLDTAVNVRAKAQKTAKVKAAAVFNQMLADQTIDRDNKVWLLHYMDYALEDASLALVQGDPKTAYSIVYTDVFNYAYYVAFLTNDSGAFSQSLLNMATLCANLVKDKDALKTIREIGQCDETTQQLIDGELKLSMHDIFVEGKAEIL